MNTPKLGSGTPHNIRQTDRRQSVGSNCSPSTPWKTPINKATPPATDEVVRQFIEDRDYNQRDAEKTKEALKLLLVKCEQLIEEKTKTLALYNNLNDQKTDFETEIKTLKGQYCRLTDINIANFDITKLSEYTASYKMKTETQVFNLMAELEHTRTEYQELIKMDRQKKETISELETQINAQMEAQEELQTANFQLEILQKQKYELNEVNKEKEKELMSTIDELKTQNQKMDKLKQILKTEKEQNQLIKAKCKEYHERTEILQKDLNKKNRQFRELREKEASIRAKNAEFDMWGKFSSVVRENFQDTDVVASQIVGIRDECNITNRALADLDNGLPNFNESAAGFSPHSPANSNEHDHDKTDSKEIEPSKVEGTPNIEEEQRALKIIKRFYISYMKKRVPTDNSPTRATDNSQPLATDNSHSSASSPVRSTLLNSSGHTNTVRQTHSFRKALYDAFRTKLVAVLNEDMQYEHFKFNEDDSAEVILNKIATLLLTEKGLGDNARLDTRCIAPLKFTDDSKVVYLKQKVKNEAKECIYSAPNENENIVPLQNLLDKYDKEEDRALILNFILEKLPQKIGRLKKTKAETVKDL